MCRLVIVGEPLNYGVQTPDTNKTVITIMFVNKDQGPIAPSDKISRKAFSGDNFFLSQRNNSEEI